MAVTDIGEPSQHPLGDQMATLFCLDQISDFGRGPGSGGSLLQLPKFSPQRLDDFFRGIHRLHLDVGINVDIEWVRCHESLPASVG